MKHFILVVSFLSGLSAFAGAWDDGNTWFVATNGADVAASSGGGTEAAPFRTLQFAHDQASAGDTIKLTPGVYAEGEVFGAQHTNRLVVSKKLRFVATGSRDETHIVGRHSTASEYGMGPDAIRCVYVNEKSSGSEFHNLTFRDGASNSAGGDPYNNVNNGASSAGGGAVTCYGRNADAQQRAYFVDCVISNCAATWGGGMYGGTAIRCLFRNNAGNSFGSVCCSAGVWNSVIIGVKQTASDRPACGNGCTVVNSLIAATSSNGYNRYGACYNTLFTSIGGTAMGGTGTPTYKNCTNSNFAVFSPATGDFRVVKGGEADGTGDASFLTSLLTLPEDTEMKDFNGNPLDLTKATCNIGPVQDSVVCDFGAVNVPPGSTVDGAITPLYKATYVRHANWLSPVVVRPTTSDFFCFKLSGDTCGGFSRRFLLLDGTFPVLPPPFYRQAITVEEVATARECWCDPDADAAMADGSEAKPYRTIQDAVVAATNALVAAKTKTTIIRLKPGVYQEGGAFACSCQNRVVLPNGYAFLIKSTDGAAVTTIRGRADPNPTYSCYAGCGPTSMRCAVMYADEASSASAIQDVTLADGHSQCVDTTKDAQSDRGGCLYAMNSNSSFLLDCVITNCTAVRGGASFYGSELRCKLYDCVSYGGVIRYGFQVGCYFDPSCKIGQGAPGAPASGVFSTDSHPFFCTAPQATIGGLKSAVSTLFGRIATVPGYAFYGSVFSSATDVSSSASCVAVRDPFFVDEEARDYRMLTRSPAVAASSAAVGARGTKTWGQWATNVVAYFQGDVEGRPLTVVDGHPAPGCFQTTVDGIGVAAAKGGIAVEGGKFGFNALGPEDSITVTMANGTRPCPGLVVNGVTNLFDTGAIRFTAADVAAQDGSILAEAFYTTDWYVNPAASDDNTGFSPKSAKRTLSAAMAATASGDTVHAAAGRYAEGEDHKTGETHPPERVYIPSGRTLVSDEGAEKTFIVGRLGTDEYTDTLGCGSNSMRCVSMAANTVLRGFTLTDGSAYPANGQTYSYNATYNHGAVWAGKRATTFVCDCVVTNCRAYLAAAGREVTFVNTLITGNRATLAVTSEANLLGCVVDGNYSDGSTVYRFTYVFDTTIGPNAYKLNGSAGTAISSTSSAASSLCNSLILGKCSTDKLTKTVSNCVFAAGCVTGKILQNTNSCWVVDTDQLQVDEDLRPIAGKNFACDRANPTLVTGEPTENVYLPPLRERANNGGRLDVGALEADWRGRYAEDILGRRFAVEAADKMVEETESRSVLVPEGTSLVGEILNKSACETPYLLKFVVPDGGSLTVTVDGQAKDYAAGAYEITVNATAATLPVSFAATAGTAEILRGKSLAGSLLLLR